MEHLFTNFLCYRGPSMGAYTDVPANEEGEHMWLGGMTKAAQDKGCGSAVLHGFGASDLDVGRVPRGYKRSRQWRRRLGGRRPGADLGM